MTTGYARRAADVSLRARFQRAIENLLPWYDVQVERARKQRSEAIAREVKVTTRDAETVRKAYEAMAERLDSVRR